MRVGRYLRVDGVVVEYVRVKIPKGEQLKKMVCPTCKQKCTNIYYAERGTQLRKTIGFICIDCYQTYIFETRPFRATITDYNGNKIGYMKNYPRYKYGKTKKSKDLNKEKGFIN